MTILGLVHFNVLQLAVEKMRENKMQYFSRWKCYKLSNLSKWKIVMISNSKYLSNKPMITVNICFSIFFSRPLHFPSMLENNVIAWMLNYVNSLGCHFKKDSKYQLSAFTDHHAHHVVTNQTFTFFFLFFSPSKGIK